MFQGEKGWAHSEWRKWLQAADEHLTILPKRSGEHFTVHKGNKLGSPRGTVESSRDGPLEEVRVKPQIGMAEKNPGGLLGLLL